jgi:FAD dependent oxidoreductase TIGR03364
MERFDDAVVGAGIIGLAVAYHQARRKRRVLVLERNPRACGASVRNFGMLWPIGQPAGEHHELALRSAGIWLEVLEACRLWHERTGSLHLAYQEDEARVLQEFADRAPSRGFACRLLDPDEAVERAPFVRRNGMRLALWSPTEICIDPRQAVAELPGWLATEFGVQFCFGRVVSGYDCPRIITQAEAYEAGRLWVCCGDDVQTLYPNLLEQAGLVRCKLQMMRSLPSRAGRRLGPMLAAGLTLRHYKAFADCPSLPSLRQRIRTESPEYDKYGIHVMAAQNGQGEFVLGDSHEYGEAVEPFDKARIEELILQYLRTFVDLPGLEIGSRWHGIYVKHPDQPYFLARPEPQVTLITGLGGAGMTLSFGLAETLVNHSSQQ